MAGKSDYAENATLDYLLSSGTVYAALFTAAPSDAGGGTEVSTGSYARTAAVFLAASSGSTSNNSTITFPTASGSWGTITHFGIFDAATSGNLLYWNALTASKTIASGDIAKFNIGALVVTED